MRLINKQAAEGDVITHLSSYHQEGGELYDSWLKKVWLNHLFKTDPGWVFPVEVQDFSDVIEGLSGPPILMVTLPVLGRVRVYAQDKWDYKDAESGTLYYYSPTRQTLHQYSQYLSSLRDYLILELFKDKEESFDVRKYAVRDVEIAAERWHKAEADRVARELEDQRKRDQVIQIRGGIDWINLCDFNAGGTKYTLVRLVTPNSCLVEGQIMHHCVGGYSHTLTNGSTVLLSIRRKDNLDMPLITAELCLHPDMVLTGPSPYARCIVQVRGPWNADANEVIPRIVENFSNLLRGLDRKVLSTLQNPEDTTFNVM
jgi:hypothetical protein